MKTKSEDKKKKKKRDDSLLEAYIFHILEQSLKKALKAGIDDILKDF